MKRRLCFVLTKCIVRSAFLWLLCLMACGVNEPLKIETLEFGRNSLAVVLNKKAPVAALYLDDGQKKITPAAPKAAVNPIIIDLNWQAGRTYRIEVIANENSSPLVRTKTAPVNAKPIVTGKLDLTEEVIPWQLHESRYLGGRTAASACGRYGAVGTEKSYLYLLDLATAEPLWQKQLGEGRLLFLEFTPDGNYLLVGEQSRDGYLYCFESTTGRILWKFSAADEVGPGEPGSGRYPVVDYIAIGQKGPQRCYVAAKRQYWEDGDYFYHSKICCLDIATGRLIWRYPETGTMDAGPSKVAVDARQRFVVFNNFKRMRYCDKAVYCLDAAQGELLWQWVYPPLYPEHRQLTWRGMDICEDGGKVVLFAQDGRAFLLENPSSQASRKKQVELLWQKNITRMIRVGDMDLYGYGAVARFKGPHLFLASGSTHAMFNKKAAFTIEHPQANTLFAYDLKGELLWLHKLGGLAYDINVSKNGNYLLMPVRSRRNQSETVHQGLYLFDLNASGGGVEKLLWHYGTQGICLDGSLSADGRRLIALTYPVDMDLREQFMDVHGAHRIYCIR